MKLNAEKTMYNIDISGMDLKIIWCCLGDILIQECKVENDELVITGDYKQLKNIQDDIRKIGVV